MPNRRSAPCRPWRLPSNRRDDGRFLTALSFRDQPAPADLAAIRRLAADSGGFSTVEVEVAVELLQECLDRGVEASGYHFLFAESGDGTALGYVCYGPVPLTAASWDLYWIAVAAADQGQGIGRKLLAAAEQRAAVAGAATLYADTSGRPDYARTRDFYRRAGYLPAAELPDFYAPGDAKVIFAKRLS
jgi:ribosomal protein S18 acetylase RimI-like enzyme